MASEHLGRSLWHLGGTWGHKVTQKGAQRLNEDNNESLISKAL